MSLSEIRVNTTKTRTGVGTITYTETGPVITGIATASNFKTGSTNVHSTGVELTNINTGGATATFGGAISGTTASFSGTVSIGGTLTYEDVTNIDSVGVITARGGITLGGGNINLLDRPDGSNHNLFFGTGAKAAAYHDGTNFTLINNTGHTYIGIGAANKDLMLYAQSTGSIILQRNTGHKYFEGVGSDGTAIIYFNTNEKLRTTNTGVSITGIPVATQNIGNVGLELHATGSGRGSQTKYHNDHGEAYVGQAGDTTGNLLVHNTSNTNIIFATNNTPTGKIANDGSTYWGPSSSTEAQMQWTHDTNQRPHIFWGKSGGAQPSDGCVVVASPQTDICSQRVGAFIFGSATSGGSGNTGLKAALECHTNASPGSDFNAGGDIRFLTKPNNSSIRENMRMNSAGNVSIGGGDPTPSASGYNKACLHIMQSNSGTGVGCQLKFSINALGHNASDCGFISYWGDKNFYYNNKENSGLHRFFVTDSSGNAGEKLQIGPTAVYVMGNLLPGANNNYDLGSTANGWRNVYTNDLNLSNLAPTGNDSAGNPYTRPGNDVDGTNGSWTIQEGKDDLYIINRLDGKKYKFNLTEVS